MQAMTPTTNTIMPDSRLCRRRSPGPRTRTTSNSEPMHAHAVRQVVPGTQVGDDLSKGHYSDCEMPVEAKPRGISCKPEALHAAGFR